jgi:hypothetical protein
VSGGVDEHLDKAFAALDDVPARELVATSEALERRKDGLRDFASIFRSVADARGGGWGTDIPRFHLGLAVSGADEKLVEQIADAPALFWRHVREAMEARKAESLPPR